jgi:hypothetical protein
MAPGRDGGGRRPLFPQPGRSPSGEGAVPGDPGGIGERALRAADRHRPGRRQGHKVQGPRVHAVPAGPELFPFLLPCRSGGGGGWRSPGRGTLRRRDRHQLRPRAGRRQQSAQPRDRGPGAGRRPGDRRAHRHCVLPRLPFPRRPSRREAFPRPRRHGGGLPQRAAHRARNEEVAPGARGFPFPGSRPREDPCPDDRPCPLPGAGPGMPGHPFPQDPDRASPGAAVVPGDGVLRRTGDESDHPALRHRTRGRDGAFRRLRRRPGVPGRKGAGGSRRGARARVAQLRGFQEDDGCGCPTGCPFPGAVAGSFGAAGVSSVGGGEGTPGAGGASLGTLGK